MEIITENHVLIMILKLTSMRGIMLSLVCKDCKHCLQRLPNDCRSKVLLFHSSKHWVICISKISQLTNFPNLENMVALENSGL